MIRLSLRLKQVYDFIEDNTNIVDIGCDHGLLDIYAYQNSPRSSIFGDPNW